MSEGSPGLLSERQLLRLMYPERYAATTIVDVRREICDAGLQLFGRRISFEERAYQSLEVTTKRGTTPNPVHVWLQLYRSVPAFVALYDSLGIPPAKLHARPQQITPELYELNVHRLHDTEFELLNVDVEGQTALAMLERLIGGAL